jgi:predicted RNase H-like HicB family nuclease
MSGSTLTFTVAVYEAEEGGYWAEVLELPGCASQGETLDELKDNVTEAIEACLQARLEDESAHPPRKVITWTLPVPEPEVAKA